MLRRKLLAVIALVVGLSALGSITTPAHAMKDPKQILRDLIVCVRECGPPQ